MVNLKEIQELINNDPAEAAKFKADPVAYLEGKGLVLPEEAKQHLTDKVQGKGDQSPVWNVGIMAGPKT
jgi:hypothetical protein